MPKGFSSFIGPDLEGLKIQPLAGVLTTLGPSSHREEKEFFGLTQKLVQNVTGKTQMNFLVNKCMYQDHCHPDAAAVAKSLQSCPTFATLWTVALQAPLSVGFSKQEYCRGLPCPPPRDLPNPGTEPACLPSPALTGRFFTTCGTWKALPWR